MDQSNSMRKYPNALLRGQAQTPKFLKTIPPVIEFFGDQISNRILWLELFL
jgi:hypothetical protein